MTTFAFRMALSTATAALAVGGTPSWADVMLPAPYVSLALDAVLLPIDEDVRATFDLAQDDTGLLVLATESGGIADATGIVPGDVLHMIGGQKIAAPVEVDEIVYYWILQGVFDFDLGVYRDGGYVEVISTISEDSYWEEVEIASIATWSAWEVETSFSYEEYYAEYSEEITESYEYSETMIEETVTSEAFTAEMSEDVSDETYEDEGASEQDEGSEEDFVEEGSDDAAAEFAEEDGSDEAYDEGEDESYDEPEEESYDDGGDEG